MGSCFEVEADPAVGDVDEAVDEGAEPGPRRVLHGVLADAVVLLEVGRDPVPVVEEQAPRDADAATLLGELAGRCAVVVVQGETLVGVPDGLTYAECCPLFDRRWALLPFGAADATVLPLVASR